MTVNAFIFSWDQYGIESIIPITQYENIEKENIFRVLKNEKLEKSPVNSIVRNLVIRAQVNSQRHYEIYAVDCDPSLDQEFWQKQWADNPQFTAELILDHGEKIYSNRRSVDEKILIT